MIDVELGKKVIIALNMLNQHPAVYNGRNSSFAESIYWWMSGTCKNGINRSIHNGEWDKDDTICFYKDEPEYAKWFDTYADEDLKQSKDDDKINARIEVPYDVVYGYPWEPVKITYHCETSYYVCDWLTIKKLSAKDKLFREYEHYIGLCGENIEADSFEEMILKIAEHVEATFGKCSLYDFQTEEEKEHKEPAFFAIPASKDTSLLINNHKYVRVSDGELNYRFWTKYYTTEAGKKLLDDHGLDLNIAGLFDFKPLGFFSTITHNITRYARELYYNTKYRLTGEAGEKFL